MFELFTSCILVYNYWMPYHKILFRYEICWHLLTDIEEFEMFCCHSSHVAFVSVFSFFLLSSATQLLLISVFRARVEHRVKQLTDGLISELQVSAERALRGGPRTARLAVTQLIRLGRSNLVCL